MGCTQLRGTHGDKWCFQALTVHHIVFSSSVLDLLFFIVAFRVSKMGSADIKTNSLAAHWEGGLCYVFSKSAGLGVIERSLWGDTLAAFYHPCIDQMGNCSVCFA